MLATAATVGGTVERSVIGRGAVVEEGAVVRDSVVLPGAVVRAGATVERAILDDLVQVERGVTVGEADGEIALVGLRANVEQDVPAGGRFPRSTERLQGSLQRRLGGAVRVLCVSAQSRIRRSTVRKPPSCGFRTVVSRVRSVETVTRPHSTPPSRR